MGVLKTIRTKNLSDTSEFYTCIKSIFGKEVSDKIHKSELTSLEDLKEHRIEMSFDDVITIWNAGVSNGVEGFQVESKEAHDYVEHGDHSVCDSTTFSKIFNVTINTWTIDEAVDSIATENNAKIAQAFDAGVESEKKKHEWHNPEELPIQ